MLANKKISVYLGIAGGKKAKGHPSAFALYRAQVHGEKVCNSTHHNRFNALDANEKAKWQSMADVAKEAHKKEMEDKVKRAKEMVDPDPLDYMKHGISSYRVVGGEKYVSA